MRFLTSGLAVAFVAIGQAAPLGAVERAVCTTKTQRRAWHTMSQTDKLAYIDAEKCLMTKPARLGLAGARTLFDELQLFHVGQTPEVHFVGAFLPYHRLFMHAHEYLLKTECNYAGGQPYWDEPLDAGKFSESIVLDAETGFGGDGQGPSNCIQDGPFKDYVNAIGPGLRVTDHCIDRNVNDCGSRQANQSFVDQCMQSSDYSTFWPCIEFAPHSGGHGGIGGQMLNVFSSPGDPIFYLHHTYLDKLWWDWQKKDLPARLTDISGTNVAPFPIGDVLGPPPGGPFGPGNGNGTCLEFPPGGFPGGFPGGPPGPPQGDTIQPSLVKRDGDPGNVTTLAHVLTVYGAVPNVTIADVMDIQGGTLCYDYV